MQKLPYKKLFLAGIFLLSPLVAQAAGLGKLTILSALGQPLSAEVDLVSVQKDEISSLVVRLAPPEAFTKANIVFSPALIGARFSIERRADGQHYAKITSTRTVNEPFINLLVELSWTRGRLVREYTALIDPPNIPPTAVAAAPVASPVLAPQVPVAAPIAAPAAPRAAAPAAAEAKPAAKAPAAARAAAPQPAAKAEAREYGPVKRGETLARIAANVKPDGVTLEQMLVGLYRSNPDAFAGNMNRMKSGQILRVPEREALVDTAPQEALKEVRVQAANWNAYRQKIADAAGDTPASESRSVARGKIAAVEDKAAAKQAPKEVVKLAKGDSAPGAGKGDKDAAATKDRIRALEDEATVREKSLAEANNRIAQLEKNIKDMQRLLELKGVAPGMKPEPAPPQAEPAKPTEKAEPAKDVAAEPAKDAEKAPEAAKVEPAPAPKPKPVAPPPPPPPAPDLLDQLTSDPLYMAGGAGILALLGVGGYMLARRRRTRANDGEDQPELRSVAVGPAGAAAAVTPMAVAPSMAQVAVDDVDPLAEADLYLNFGRDTQAEEVLKDALAKNPNHEEAKLKLLQIFAGRKDKDAFEKVAKDLHAQTDGIGDNWLKAAGMGYALDAANPLYEAGSSAPAAELPSTGGAATDLDFDLELAPDANVGGTKSDFEFDAGKTVVMQPGELAGLAAGGVTVVTQDITADSGAARAIADSASAEAPDFTLNKQADGGTSEPDLMIGGTDSDEMARSVINLDAGSGNMIDFNFDETAATTPAPEAPPEKVWAHDKTLIISPENQDNAAGLNIDFDLGKSTKVETDVAAKPPDFTVDIFGKPKAPSAEDVALPDAPLPELKLDDIHLDFDASLDQSAKAEGAIAPATGEGGSKDDRWYDVQTKFDLAKAYQEMGDKDGTREILLEVIKEGDPAQQAEAKALLDSLG